MKWRKLGKIFDPTEHALPVGEGQYAQSPQTLVFENFIRIFFSTRSRDSTGKFLSHVCYVDMPKDFERVLAISSSPVIELGAMGDFDEHGIFPMNVVREKNGEGILAYTTGWNRRASVPVDASIGLAISYDGGESFTKIGKGPVLSSSLHEPFLVGDGFVLVDDDVYHMWYIHGTKWLRVADGEAPERVYKIAHATSADGKHWDKEGRQIIADTLNVDECQALPTVVWHDDRYHMMFCYRQAMNFRSNTQNSYRLGYASSNNLVDWTRSDSQAGIDVSEAGWDSEMLAYPHLFKSEGKVYLLYNGNQFGRFGFGLAVLEE